MNCSYFGSCGSCNLDYNYQQGLSLKIAEAKEILALDINAQIFASPEEFYRNRAEFRVFFKNDEIFYALFDKNKKLLPLNECKKVSLPIFNLMPLLLEEIKKDEILKYKLFYIEFLSSDKEMLVSLIYHKKLDEIWLQKAKLMAEKLGIFIIGRSRGIKLISHRDFIYSSLKIGDKSYKYEIKEGAFSQPNTTLNESMITWVRENLGEKRKDLLELYCGHGNFTIVLSFEFQKVLATEIAKASIRSALNNCQLNGVKNVTFLRMDVQDLVSALKKQREFFRLKDINLDEFNFSHVFVDPPRSGLDEESLNFVSRFENIIYISCNIHTLARDLGQLSKTHKAIKLAFFDQFAHTKHLESGVILRKKHENL